MDRLEFWCNPLLEDGAASQPLGRRCPITVLPRVIFCQASKLTAVQLQRRRRERCIKELPLFGRSTWCCLWKLCPKQMKWRGLFWCEAWSSWLSRTAAAVSSEIYSVSALSLLRTSYSTTCLLREYQHRLEMGRRCLDQASSLVSGLAWLGVEKVPSARVRAALCSLPSLPWQQLLCRHGRGFCAGQDPFLFGSAPLEPAIWSRCQPYPPQTETRTHNFRNFSMSFCSLESLQGFVTVQIVSLFLLIILGKWTVKEGSRQRFAGGAEDRPPTLLKVGNASAWYFFPWLREISALLEYFLGWHRDTSMICWH